MLNKKHCILLLLLVMIFIFVNIVSASDINATELDVAVEDDAKIEVASADNYSISNTEDVGVSSDVSNIPVIEYSKTVQSNDIVKYYNGKTKYSATFLDENGNLLKNTNVKITVKGTTYTKKTNGNGVASLNINLKPGTYKVTAENTRTGYKLTTNLKILSTIKAKDISKVVNDNHKFTAKFLKNNGKPLSKATIQFKVNGKKYKVKTDKKGVAKLSVKNLKKGTYKIISFNKDGLTKTNKIKVVKSTTTSLTSKAYTFLKTDKAKTVKVKLLNKFGYAPGKGKLIKFKINGKIYSSKTDSKGVAKLKLPALKNGVYTIKYSFKGNKYYKKSSVKNTVAIIPKSKPTFTVKSTKTFGYGAGTPFKVALTSGKVPLAKRVITLNVDGKTYTKTTNSKGIVSLPINLDVGKYTITYKNKAESKVKSVKSSAVITVKTRRGTNVVWESAYSFNQGVQKFKVSLKDSDYKILKSKKVKLTVNSKTYSATTDSNGIAVFDTNLLTGDYKVSFKYGGDNDYAPSSNSAEIKVVKNNHYGFGYYVHGSEMNKVDLNKLASKGTGELFLNYYAISLHGKSAVEKWISKANSLGMRVHIWHQVFYKTSSGWINPVSNSKYVDSKISEAMDYAKIKGVAGVHLDYLRFNGNAYRTSGSVDAINDFVKKVSNAVHGIDSNLIVSCTVMPEPSNNLYYYGQDYSVISRYVDVVIPMIYKGNYGKDSNWVSTTSKWFADNSQGARVWVGLQGYYSDSNLKHLPVSEISKDVGNVVNSGADGAVIFRVSLTEAVNFNSFTKSAYSNNIPSSDMGNSGKSDDSSHYNNSSDNSGNDSSQNSNLDNSNSTNNTPLNNSTNNTNSSSSSGIVIKYVNINDIVNAAYQFNSIIPIVGVTKTVYVNGEQYPTHQFLYMMTKTVEYMNNNLSVNVGVLNVTQPSNIVDTASYGVIYKNEYLNLASRINSYAVDNNSIPDSLQTSIGKMGYDDLVVLFTQVLANADNKLPDSVVMDTLKEDSQKTKLSINEIVEGARDLKEYFDSYKYFLNPVKAGGVNFQLCEFTYLMAQAISQISNSNFNDITFDKGMAEPNSPLGDNIHSTLEKSEYVIVADNIINFVKKNNHLPNYASSRLGDINYFEIIDAFSRILIYYGDHGNLPGTVLINWPY